MKPTPLPAYLRMATHAAPDSRQVFVSGDLRLTVLTPCLVRIQQGNDTDAATLTVIQRDLGPCPVEASTEGGGTILRTGMLTLRHNPALPLSQGLTIQREAAPAFLWRYGDKPTHNLGGTTSTLDGVDGACPSQDGV